MNLEKLRQLLEAGSITQEEFDEMAKAVKEPEANNSADPNADNNTANEAEPKNDHIDMDKLDRIIQARVDKLMAAERKKSAELKTQLDRERKARMTDDELKQIEIDEKEKAIAEREKAITDKENRLYAVKAIKAAGLDSGDEDSLALVDFVLANDEVSIDEKVNAFKKLFTSAVDKAVKAEVDKRFGEAARTPKKGNNTLNGGRNPYTKEQWNLTEQMSLEVSNPELAAQLKAAAGAK